MILMKYITLYTRIGSEKWVIHTYWAVVHFCISAFIKVSHPWYRIQRSINIKISPSDVAIVSLNRM